MDDNLLLVKMLGSFSIQMGGKTVTLTKNRESRMLHLLQYLLYNHGSQLSIQKLAEVVYEDEEIDNPVKALQVLITRLRQALVAAGLPQQEYILYSGGRYTWNSQVPCWIDTYEFEESVKQARLPELGQKHKLEYYVRAIELYEGDFLPELSGCRWATVVTAYNTNLFLQAVEEVWQILSATGDYALMLKLCSKAIGVYPSEERLHMIKIRCLIKENHLKEALGVYHTITEMLLNEWGVEPSDALKELYREIAVSYEGAQLPLSKIRDEIAEEEKKDGAYYCPLVSFIDSYHFILRVIERSGQSVFLVLCDLSDPKGKTPRPGEALANAAEALSAAIRKSLRRGDLYTRYSSAQFLVLLVGTNIENCTPISKRIAANFKKLFSRRGIYLKYSVLPAGDISFDGDYLTFSKNHALWKK